MDGTRGSRRQLGEDIQHLTAPQLTLHDSIASGIDAVDLKHGLGKIQPARSNPSVGMLFMDGS